MGSYFSGGSNWLQPRPPVIRCLSLVYCDPLPSGANLYPQVRGGGLVRIIRWLISIAKRAWNRTDVSKISANEDYEDTYYNILSFQLQR